MVLLYLGLPGRPLFTLISGSCFILVRTTLKRARHHTASECFFICGHSPAGTLNSIRETGCLAYCLTPPVLLLVWPVRSTELGQAAGFRGASRQALASCGAWKQSMGPRGEPGSYRAASRWGGADALLAPQGPMAPGTAFLMLQLSAFLLEHHGGQWASPNSGIAGSHCELGWQASWGLRGSSEVDWALKAGSAWVGCSEWPHHPASCPGLRQQAHHPHVPGHCPEPGLRTGPRWSPPPAQHPLAADGHQHTWLGPMGWGCG